MNWGWPKKRRPKGTKWPLLYLLGTATPHYWGSYDCRACVTFNFIVLCFVQSEPWPLPCFSFLSPWSEKLKSLFCSDTAGRISHCKKSSRELLAFFLILFSPNKIRMAFPIENLPFSLFYLCQNKCEQKTFLLIFFRNSSKGYKKVVTWAMLIHK